MDEVLHESVLSEFSLEVSFGTNILFVFLLKDKFWCTKNPIWFQAVQITVKHHVASRFSHLLHDISGYFHDYNFKK